MDATDKFINNKTPKRLFLYFLIIFLISIAAEYFMAGKYAEIMASEHIYSVLSASAGNIDISSSPSFESISEGEKICSEYGLSADISPKFSYIFTLSKNIIFHKFVFISFLICISGFLISLLSVFKIYNNLEKISEECINIEENGGEIIGEYGEDFSCVRRVSDRISRIGCRMDYLTQKMTSEKIFLKDFLSDFSHQLKTSLAVIRLNNDILDTVDYLTEEKQQQLTEEINISLDDMEKLVYSALKLAKLNADSVSYSKSKADLSVMCRKAIQKVSAIATKKNIEIIFKSDKDVYFEYDDVWLTEAVANLIKNSADHANCTFIEISLSETPMTVIISISDNGKGIPQSVIPHIFERFGKINNKSGMNSIGIGMSIAEKIVRAHDGEILIYSSEGKGTKFEIVMLK